MSARIFPARPKALVQYGGRHKISGTTIKDGTPGSCRVVLMDRSLVRPVLAEFSNSAGEYQFEYLSATQSYAICAFDPDASPVTAAISDQPDLVQMV